MAPCIRSPQSRCDYTLLIRVGVKLLVEMDSHQEVASLFALG